MSLYGSIFASQDEVIYSWKCLIFAHCLPPAVYRCSLPAPLWMHQTPLPRGPGPGV